MTPRRVILMLLISCGVSEAMYNTEWTETATLRRTITGRFKIKVGGLTSEVEYQYLASSNTRNSACAATIAAFV